jgi:hypothetical protein
MEEAPDSYSLENEFRGMDVNLGVQGSNSNEHGEEIDKYLRMRKIIKKLQKYFQINREDNKRIMRDREQ